VCLLRDGCCRSLFLTNVGIIAVLSFDNSSLCFEHHSSMVLRNSSTDVMTASWDGPWIIRSMSSAYVTISRFGTLNKVSISPLIVMFQRAGPATVMFKITGSYFDHLTSKPCFTTLAPVTKLKNVGRDRRLALQFNGVSATQLCSAYTINGNTG